MGGVGSGKRGSNRAKNIRKNMVLEMQYARSFKKPKPMPKFINRYSK